MSFQPEFTTIQVLGEDGQVLHASQYASQYAPGEQRVFTSQNYQNGLATTPAKQGTQVIQYASNNSSSPQKSFAERTLTSNQQLGQPVTTQGGWRGSQFTGATTLNGPSSQVVRRSYRTITTSNFQTVPGTTQVIQGTATPIANGFGQTQNTFNVNGFQTVVQDRKTPSQSIHMGRRSYQVSSNTNGYVTNEVVRHGDSRVISENKLQSRVIETTQGQPHVVDIKYGQSHEISRSVHVDTNVRVKENRLETREQRPSLTHNNLNKDVNIRSEKAVINQRIVEKPIDVYIEKPVPVYREVEVPYDVIVEKPIEKIIERDIITEIIMQKEIEKIVEIPVHKVIEVPIEKTIERPVFYDKFVDVPREVYRDVEKNYVTENPVYVERVIEVDERDIGKYKYDKVLPTEVKVFERPVYKEQRSTHRNIVEKMVDVPVEKIVQRPVQKLIDRPVERLVDRPVYVDNYIEKIVQVPVENIIYNRYEQVVEEPEYIDQIIEKPVHVERIVHRNVDQYEEVIVEMPIYIDRIIEKEVDVMVEREVRIDREVQVPVQRIVERPVYRERTVRKEVPKIIEQEVIYETTIPVEKINIVEEVIPVPIDRIIERPVERTVEKYVDVLVEREVYEDNIVEDIQYVEKIVHVPLERVVERPVYRENIIEKNVYIDKIIEKSVEVLVEKIVEVPVEKIIEVPIDVIVENPIPRQRIVEREVFIDKKVTKPRASKVNAGTEDSHVRYQVQTLQQQITETKITVSKLRAEYELIQKKQINLTLHSDIDYTSQNTKLRELIAEMERKIGTIKSGIGQSRIGQDGVRVFETTRKSGTFQTLQK